MANGWWPAQRCRQAPRPQQSDEGNEYYAAKGELIERPRFALRGRPRKWERPDDMAEAVQDYFAWADERGWPYAWADVAVHLGISREALDNYSKGEYGRHDGTAQGFVDVLKRANALLEGQAERRLQSNGQAAGAIFWLKNRAGYKKR